MLQNREDLLEYNLTDINTLYSFSLLKDIEKAVVRITQALNKNERITIYGDYDADGITSTAILYMYLKSKNANVDYYIPVREDEGYGINIPALNLLFKKGTNLIITVDTGITANEEIAHAATLGMDVIITDHHECKNNIPKCHAVINPKRADCPYPFKELAGVGVVFKLLQALEGGKNTDLLQKRYIGLVCLGTIADVAPLIGENRVLVSLGLRSIAVCQNAGIKALLEVTKLAGKTITAGHIGFILAPRINAAGRLANAYKSLELFLCGDSQTAYKIALELSDENKYRQEIEHKIFLEAVKIIEENNLHKKRVIVVANENWHQGVIGIVSSKITEKYYRPSILISTDKNSAKGSGRSITGFNLFEALTYSKDCLLKFGGHALAAGLSLSLENIPVLRDKINEYADKLLSEEKLIPVLYIDAAVKKDDITIENVTDLSRLEPYGMGNAQPVFSYEKAKVAYITTLSGGKHLKIIADKDNIRLEAIGFNMGDTANGINYGDVIDIAGSLNINLFKDKKKVQLIIKDIKKV